MNPEIINALARHASAVRLLEGVTDSRKREFHINACRQTARSVMSVMDAALRAADLLHLDKGIKVGSAGKHSIIRRGNAYEAAIAAKAEIIKARRAFEAANASHLCPVSTTVSSDSTQWPSWMWAGR